MSIQIRFFERASLGKTISDPKGKKLWYPFLRVNFSFCLYKSLFDLQPVLFCCLWRLKSENFWVTFFCTSIPLRGRISKCQSNYVFFERASLGKTLSDRKGKKQWYFFRIKDPESKLTGHTFKLQNQKIPNQRSTKIQDTNSTNPRFKIQNPRIRKSMRIQHPKIQI